MTQSDKELLTILYLRLSREDDSHEGESNSIENQRAMLLDYAKEHDFENIKVIVDDGFSGTTDDRKGFREMIDLVESDQVDTVIVKDMSRFGRNYLLVGNYLEIVFPLHNTRLISVNERMDTKDGIDDFMPFIHIMDEYYSKGLSKKIRASYRLKSKQGFPIGHAPYGYKPDPEEPRRWVVDEEAAENVRYIYQLRLKGLGINKIAEQLRIDKIHIPTIYAMKNGTKKPKNKVERGEYFWSHNMVRTILKNQSYTGDVVNFKTYSKSHKLKKRLENDKENWEIHTAVHDPVVEREVWEQVQKTFRNTKYRKPKYTEKNMFAGLLVCSDCGANLNHKHLKDAPHNDYFSCGRNRKSKSLCKETHHIRIDSLTEIAKIALNSVVAFARDFEDEFVKIVSSEHYKQICLSQERNRKDLAGYQSREKQLDILFENLYEDKILGTLSEERYKKLADKYEQEQAELTLLIADAQKLVTEDNKNELNVDRFLAMVRKYTRVEELTQEILHHFIHKIVVYHREELNMSQTQKVDIYFNFIGQIKLPTPQERKQYLKSFGRKKENQIA